MILLSIYSGDSLDLQSCGSIFYSPKTGSIVFKQTFWLFQFNLQYICFY